MNLFSSLKQAARKTEASLKDLALAVDKAYPIPGRHKNKLKFDVAEISSLFTHSRQERGVSYLGKPNLLSAYLRYFLPWNVYRLCRLLPALPLHLKDGDAVVDLGSGPLSLVLALWISRPELRKLNLEFRCIDRTSHVLEAGKKIFEALVNVENNVPTSGDGQKWKIKTIKGEIQENGQLSVPIHGKPAALVGAVNVYNEIFWNFSPMDKTALRNLSVQSGHLLKTLCAADGNILIVEPGIPRSGEFTSMLRAALIDQSMPPLSPCTHERECPFPGHDSHPKERKIGGKAKWCHFSFNVDGVPDDLVKLSAAAGIPKDRSFLSFLLAGKKESGGSTDGVPANGIVPVRIISESFPVGDRMGCYGCTAAGAALCLLPEKENADRFHSGSEAMIKLGSRRDSKSGALIGDLTDI